MAGKHHKAVCENLGVENMINSPTFSIINEYSTTNEDTIITWIAIDRKESEAMDIGVTDYLYSGNYCFIEWPEKIERLLPDDVVRVKITEIENEIRVVEFGI